MKKLIVFCLITLLCIGLVACGTPDDPTPTPDTPSGDVTPDDPTPDDPTPDNPTPDNPTPDDPAPELLDFTGITFPAVSVTYDGEEHSARISGTLPEGARVTYTDADATDAGSYTATAKLTCEGYNDKTLTTTITIARADIVGVTFDGKTVEYDTAEHTLAVVGNVPSGVTVKYTCGGEPFTFASAVGTYRVVATLNGKNYNTLTLEATLTVKSTESLLYTASFGGAIYFQNDLDGKTLYKYENGNVKKVNRDVAECFFTDGTYLYYYSSSLFSKSIKRIDASGKVSIVLSSVNGDFLTTDGAYVYYAVNALFSKDAGIWRYKLDGTEEATRICTDKAEYLTVVGDKLYYSNKSEGGKLYSVPKAGGASAMIHDEKVSYIISDGDMLYFDSSKTLGGSAIYSYKTTDGTLKKLTTDSGKYLTKIDGYVYYVNNDLLTSNIFGDGIYKVSTALNSGVLPGIRELSAEGNGYSSVTTDGEYLYYYKLNDKHLYKYDPATGTETDLMAGFIPPVEPVTPAGNTVVAVYNGEIYYTDPTDGVLYGACLYKYDPTTDQHVKVIADDVAGIWFSGDKLYYSTCILTNYALFRMDLTTGETVKVNSDRCEDLIFEGEYIYYLEVHLTGSNRIMRISVFDIGMDVEPEVIYDDKNIAVTGMFKSGDTFYFVVNPAIGKQKLYKYTVGDTKATDLGETAFELVADGDTLYFYDDYDNAIKRYVGGSVTTLVSGVTVNDLELGDGVLYYSSTEGKIGVYSFDLTTSSVTRISSKVGEALTADGDTLWFICTAVEYTADYPVHKGSGDYELYLWDGSNLTKK